MILPFPRLSFSVLRSNIRCVDDFSITLRLSHFISQWRYRLCNSKQKIFRCKCLKNAPKIGRPLFCPKHAKHVKTKKQCAMHFVHTPDKTSSFSDLFYLSNTIILIPHYLSKASSLASYSTEYKTHLKSSLDIVSRGAGGGTKSRHLICASFVLVAASILAFRIFDRLKRSRSSSGCSAYTEYIAELGQKNDNEEALE